MSCVHVHIALSWMVDLGMEFADVNASSCQFFSLTQALQKGSHVTSEGKALKIKKNSTGLFWWDNGEVRRQSFLLTTKLYNNPNGAALLVPKNQKNEGNEEVDLEGMTNKKK